MYEKELRAAAQAAKLAEKTFRRYYGTKTQVRVKDKNYRNLVSLADKKIEKDIKAFLQKRFPGYGFMGEEYGAKNPSAEYLWVLDPIDGTTNYIQGIPYCCISLALCHRSKPIVGTVYGPLMRELYTARVHHGAYCNGMRIRVSQTRTLTRAFGALSWGKDNNFGSRMAQKFTLVARKIRVMGSSALAGCQVASGKFDFIADGLGGMGFWDVAAASLIVKEAGGKVYDTSDAFPTPHSHLKNLTMSNPHLKKELLHFRRNSGV